MHVHDLMPFHTSKFNMSHVITKLSFGADFPGVVNPLDGRVSFSLSTFKPQLDSTACMSGF